MKKVGSSIILIASLLVFALASSGCAPPHTQTKASTATVTSCVIPPDQNMTLASRWRMTQGSPRDLIPIPVAFSSGQFDSGEIADITAAGEVWNTFTNKNWGVGAIDTGGGRTTSQAKPANNSLCAGGLISNNKFVGSVNIYKESPWQSSNHSAIALTTFCTTTDQGSSLPNPKRTYMAVMEVNYQDFFVDGKKLPDIKSIFIHEFGHLMGLGHSCEASNTPNAPNCTGSPDSYLEAVMFPVVFFDTLGNGEQRLNLMPNDQGRANCLYGSNQIP